MKSNIFLAAISNRYKLKFLYNLNEIELDPYFIANNKCGKKVIYGRVNNSFEVKMFEYDKILNIKVLDYSKFSPIIPLIPMAN
ncbi:MAG: hypothetical protein KJ799_04180 [Bacteroidetes bacterium]|nr:hypothetical protein [Bacteroidota bacterium]MBU1679407.1 hypothetical protein [Bacteroidota bacterium]MBU2505905.1 hypothetical protein [Bacteroidota bacterium]